MPRSPSNPHNYFSGTAEQRPFPPRRNFSAFLSLLILAAPFFLSCGESIEPPVTDASQLKCEIQKEPPFPGGTLTYLHLQKDTIIGGSFHQAGPGTSSTIEPVPIRVSETRHDDFIRSLEMYRSYRFEDAFKILLDIYEAEPENLFVIHQMGKTLYRTPGQKGNSLAYFQKLQDLIQKKHPEVIGEMADLWFIEAYYQMGTVYLDLKEWDKAILNIRKIYDFSASSAHPGSAHMNMLLEQAAAFLTEATFQKKDRAANHYYYCRTLSYNPENPYIKPFLLP